MSLLLARLSAAPVVVVFAAGFAEGQAEVIGVGQNGAAVDGATHMVRTSYAVDPPNRFWPDPSIRTY